ncbi:UDP-galactopyranose mutase precursor [Variovorax sp. PBL-H6]|uniref:NAD(P)-binding protein n=1 Tax=Variovorax sp. PBL-H6 TaxID=434009 RepID=UPI0013170596|nr:NAD(P)-binding protein [Variovorax sp. PBL-H6]VTU26846.1 UDP-galactopyranose mutase precursor [Variovorax sp. PBL-H6]
MTAEPISLACATARAYDFLIVGGGSAGCVLAERLTSQLGLRVLIIDRRPPIGGNAYDHLDEHGVMVHRYGPHIFHTNSLEILDYLSQFTQWRPYEHRVLAQVDGQLLPIPINLTTINGLFGLQLDAAGDAALPCRARVARDRDQEFARRRDQPGGRRALPQVLRRLHPQAMGRDASLLDRSVTSRVPTRTDDDDRYFQDRYQCMPLHGYTRMFERMIAHEHIDFLPQADFAQVRPPGRCRSRGSARAHGVRGRHRWLGITLLAKCSAAAETVALAAADRDFAGPLP